MTYNCCSFCNSAYYFTAGKSTTLKLITRMLEVDSGSILVDGADISCVAKDSVRERVAVVPQDNCLFDDTGRLCECCVCCAVLLVCFESGRH